MEVTFLRHAKTDLNGKGYIATKKDYFLNEIGREECLRNVFPPDILIVFIVLHIGEL